MYRLLTCDGPISDPAQIVNHMSHDYGSRPRTILAALCVAYPARLSREYLMRFSEIDRDGPICKFTAFEFWVCRIERGLRRAGWQLKTGGGQYWLSKEEQ